MIPENPNYHSDYDHVTGQSVFLNDMATDDRLLIGKVIYSRHAHARIRSLEIKEALKVKGVHAILTAKDIPGENQMGTIIRDEPCLAGDTVTFIGQAIVLVAAEDEEALRQAEKLIAIEFEPMEPILDIETAMALNDLIAPERKIERGDVVSAMKNVRHHLSGTLKTGAQEHWYLETQSALAVPGEGREIRIYASSQSPADTQAVVAGVLGLLKNQVEVEVRRIGGAFGGKETQGNHVAAWAALLANATHCPVKIILPRNDDQIMTGKRHRFLSTYEIGFDDDGMIQAYSVELNADAGSATDLTRAILERAMLHAENCYFIPHIRIVGRALRTNLPSNTAFRGFGGPQGMAVIENAIDRVARFLKKDAAEIRFLNFYQQQERNITPYGEEVANNHLSRIYQDILVSSDYLNRKKAVAQFNQENEFLKKGLALTPVKFGISFTTAFLNQAGALVNCYTDGSVMVNHGGTEMGQGLYTKILQIASSELGIPPAMIKVNATNTSKVPNTSPTAASSGSDINGMAVKNAIDILKSRLAGLKEKISPDKDLTFEELCKLAHENQVSLSAFGFYKTPGLSFNRETGQGHPFFYFSFGMAVSEVMVDTLTGSYTLLRSDIIQDVGDSINEAIDRGQTEGGFIQGVGWCTMEEIKWDKNGNLLTFSPDTYKIPTVNDIPPDFRITLSNVPHEGTIRQSKAVGEPPFMLGLSVWLAIKNAISATKNHETEPEFSLPATYEVILVAIEKLKD
ncbi:MAG: xanthine dehydrogenase molybdopterin binding subunit [Bacteroidales bacterium]|nr:xanthine dehydrogenase molybdopterin binding subunit [Bacteroidales bacterium]